MKTPEEIKKGLELCEADDCYEEKHTGCPYDDDELCIRHLCGNALAYINQLESRVPKWISVKDRVPEIGTVVLGYAKQNPFSAYDVMRVRNLGNGFEMIRYHEYASSVTHWMPLTEPPKEE